MNACGRSQSSRLKTGFHLCRKNSPIHQSDSPDTPLCRPNIVYNRILLRTNSPQSLPRMTRVSAHSWNWYLLVLAGLLVLCQDSLPLDWFHTQLTKPATWCLTRIYWILDNQVTEGHTVVMPVELGYLMLDRFLTPPDHPLDWASHCRNTHLTKPSNCLAFGYLEYEGSFFRRLSILL